jgi:hypothetical protein
LRKWKRYGSQELFAGAIHSKLSIMKKLLFLLVVAIAWMSCSKEGDFIQVAAKKKDSTSIYIDFKPMPKGVIPPEILED